MYVSARFKSFVKIDDDKPYATPFATSTASSKLRTVMITSTGPKISSRAIAISGVTRSNTVGAMKQPWS